MRRALIFLTLLTGLGFARDAHAFCGFYVARSDAGIFNQSSQVAIVRDGNHTVLTLANDFAGDLDAFAMVVPVPASIARDQVRVVDPALIEHLDAYSSPRLVEYFDPNPCNLRLFLERLYSLGSVLEEMDPRAASFGVTVEASYTVGEYDILILSAAQSQGLVQWLKERGYRLPNGAEPLIAEYLERGLRFFVARVNLERQTILGHATLRPLQIRFESESFMLPIRLGMLNAVGSQDLYIYLLSRSGRVDVSNYRTVKLPTGMNVPLFVKDDFARFYADLFARQVEREQRTGVFLEYAWDMGWCDPCTADPLSVDELQRIGVSWLAEEPPGQTRPKVFLTRLRLRYDPEHFPEDLVFRQTGDLSQFQGRYVLRHPWMGPDTCPSAERYRRGLPDFLEREAQNLASLTGWDIVEIRSRMNPKPPRAPGSQAP